MKVKVEILQGDITESDAEAIVNAANNHLWMGSGVAGAIKRKGGQVIEDEAVRKGPIPVGQAVETTAGNLPFKYILHAAGMGQDLRTSPEIVFETTVNTVLLADRLELKSVAFPAIGTGVGGLSLELCARTMKKAIEDTSARLQHLEIVQFVLYDKSAFDIFRKELE